VNSSDATLGGSLRLAVKEQVIPTITITSPSAGAHLATSAPVISFSMRDEVNGSGVNLSSLQIKLDGGAAIASGSNGVVVTPAIDGYDVTYTPQSALSDGVHAVTINVSDNDGNAAEQVSRSFTTSTIAPVLNIASPQNDSIGNSSSVTLQGVTNNAGAASPATVSIALNGVAQGLVPIESDGSFSLNLTLAEGENTIVVTATDLAGNSSISTITTTLDTSVPQFTSVSIAPNPANTGASVIISIGVT
jgi:hypothetical protein